MKMMMSVNFAPEPGDFFYNTDSEGNNTETDNKNYTPKEAANKKQKISPKKILYRKTMMTTHHRIHMMGILDPMIIFLIQKVTTIVVMMK